MLKTALQDRIIEKFKLYWRCMGEARKDNDQDGVLYCYHHLNAIIDLLEYIYPKIDISMIINKAAHFAYTQPDVIKITPCDYFDR